MNGFYGKKSNSGIYIYDYAYPFFGEDFLPNVLYWFICTCSKLLCQYKQTIIVFYDSGVTCC